MKKTIVILSIMLVITAAFCAYLLRKLYSDELPVSETMYSTTAALADAYNRCAELKLPVSRLSASDSPSLEFFETMKKAGIIDSLGRTVSRGEKLQPFDNDAYQRATFAQRFIVLHGQAGVDAYRAEGRETEAERLEDLLILLSIEHPFGEWADIQTRSERKSKDILRNRLLRAMDKSAAPDVPIKSDGKKPE